MNSAPVPYAGTGTGSTLCYNGTRRTILFVGSLSAHPATKFSTLTRPHNISPQPIDAMNIIEALKNRKSTRAFLRKEISKEQVTRILEAARHAPSGTNAQPWEVAVVSGETKQQLTTALVEAFRNDGLGEMDYEYYPVKWKEPFKRRRVTCGAQLYSALNIERKDRARRLEQWEANYRGFDAPVLLFFFLDSIMEKGSFLDYGMFIQSIMLAALQEGLATCAQAALGQHPELIKKKLQFGENYTLICGMALGYEDTAAPQNNYRTAREDVEVFTRFFK